MQTKVTKKGETIYFSVVEKESDKKLKFNDRLFIYLENQFFGYISTFDKNNLSDFCDPRKLKKKVPLQDLRRIIPKGNILSLYINEYEEGKLNEIKWVLKMSTEALAFNWMELLTKVNSPFRKTTEYKDENKVLPFKIEDQAEQIKEEEEKKQNNEEKEVQEVAKEIPQQKEHKENQNEQIKLEQIEKEVKNIPFIHKPPSESSRKSEKLDEVFDMSEIKKNEELFFKRPVSENVDFMKRKEEKVKEKKPVRISELLQQKIDLFKVEEELQQFKQSRTHKLDKAPLSSNIHLPEETISFLNYFRPLPSNIDDHKYFQFLNYCEKETKKLVEIMQSTPMEENQKLLQLEDVDVILIRSELKQVPDKSSICDEGLYKKYLGKMKNMNYIWKVIASDRLLSNSFFVPMACICEYRGFFCYFQCKYEREKKLPPAADFSSLFQRLSEKTHIHKEILQNKEDIRFQRVRKGFIINDVNSFLPNLLLVNSPVRPELMEESFKTGETYESRKGKKEEYQQNKIFKEKIESKVKTLSSNLQKLEEYVVHPRQFSTLLHLYGLNMKFLSHIYHRITNIFMKDIIKTEVALRSFKPIFRKKLQDQQLSQYQIQNLVVRFLNILLTQSQQSEKLWKIITLHSQLYFGLPVEKEEMNKGYLLLGLEHQLGLDIQQCYPTCDKIFKCDRFVEKVELLCKKQPCQLMWLPIQQEEASSEEVQYVIRELNLKSRDLPYIIKASQEKRDQVLYHLSQFYGPTDFRHLNLYSSEQNDAVSLVNMKKKLSQIKWLIKDGSLTDREVEKQLMEVKERMSRYFGQYHPFYNEIYDLLINYNLALNKYEKAITCCKSALANMIQLCGGNNTHVKLASNYYQLGDCYHSWGKTDEAISYYKKAKNILEVNQFLDQTEYALIQLKLASLHFSKFKDQQCEKLLKNSFNILKLALSSNVQSVVQCLELMNRCMNDPSSQSFLVAECFQVLKVGLESECLTDEESLKLGKIIVEYFLKQEGRRRNEKVEEYMEKVADGIAEGWISVEEAVATFQEFVINERLLDTFENFCSKAEKYLKAEKRKENIMEKELALFDKLVRSCMSCFGEGFMTGAFTYHL